jgi:cell division protease FtsH
MKLTPRIFAFVLIVLALLVVILSIGLVVETRCAPAFPPGTEIPYSQLLADIETGRVREVVIRNSRGVVTRSSEVSGTRFDGGKFATDVPDDPTPMRDLYKLLQERHVIVTVKPAACA